MGVAVHLPSDAASCCAIGYSDGGNGRSILTRSCGTWKGVGEEAVARRNDRPDGVRTGGRLT